MEGHPQSRHSTNSNVPSILTAFLLTVLVLHPATAQASLFFSPEETQAIETLVQAETRKAEQRASPAQEDISLGAILYYGPQNWKIWLQGEFWTPETRHHGLRVLKVSPDRVTLKIALDPPVKITLKPNQTWSIANRNIGETENIVDEE